MKEKVQLSIPRTSLEAFLSNVSRVTPSAILKIYDHKIETVVSYEESMFLGASMTLPKTDDNDVNLSLPLIDIKKFIDLSRMCKGAENLDLEIIGNVVKVKYDKLRLKIHLAEPSVISRPSEAITVEKIKGLNTSFETEVSVKSLSQLESGHLLVKGSSGDTKVYFYLVGDKLVGEITDKTSDNNDSYQVDLVEGCTGEFSDEIPVKFDVWKLMGRLNEDIIFKAIPAARKGLEYHNVLISQERDGIELHYLFNRLKG